MATQPRDTELLPSGSAIVPQERSHLRLVPEAPAITAERIAEEHRCVRATITDEQWEVIRREEYARNIRSFHPGKSESQILEEFIFANEARSLAARRDYDRSRSV